MTLDKIIVRGARVHNLKNINVEIPKNKLTVITGLSGSGKSSLAFDTIYAEGQRRYIESISSYARKFLGIMDKPEVESISGLSPTLAIDQRGVSRNPRSTVGTMTEIYDYLRLLFSRIGRPHCPVCGKEIFKQSINQIIKDVLKFSNKSEVFVLAPIVRNEIFEKKDTLEKIRQAGYVKIRFNNKIYSIKELEGLDIDPLEKHNLEVIVDKLNPYLEKAATIKAVETALELGNGLVIINRVGLKQDKSRMFLRDRLFSQRYICLKCGFTLPDLEPRLFSFNSPQGACPECQGLGEKLNVDSELLIPNKNLTIAQGAIRPWARMYSSRTMKLLEKVAAKHSFSLNVPAKDLTKKSLDIIFYGAGDEEYEINDVAIKFEGAIKDLEQKYQEAKSDYIRKEIEKYMRVSVCPVCNGKRLKPLVLGIEVDKKDIAQMTEMSVKQAINLFDDLSRKKDIKDNEREIAQPIIKEVKKRLSFLDDVGLDYLTLDRSSTTLSGGEAQRIKLATQLGSALSGVIYVLDEPTVGLHPKDVDRLIKTVRELIKQENTVIIVEHDLNTMRVADTIIDLGPGAGKYGGEVMAVGPFKKIQKDKKSLTGQYLSGQLKIEVPPKFRHKNGKKLVIKGATAFNLKNINVEIPLASLVCVTGVSGSGKSTLMVEILAKALAHKLYGAKELPAEHKDIQGLKNIDKVVNIDQSPIGRSPHSNPATYTGVFTYIRDLFAQLPESKIRGYTAGHFSFNVVGGRCEACKGQGVIEVEMQFLPSVYINCEECNGTRYNKEILEIHYQGKNIAQALDMSVKEAREFFADIEPIANKLDILHDVGLDYVKLGQPATTLSGGEAQRIKLATELSRRETGKTLYLLDEPTTGLHFADVKKLLDVLNKLVELGNTVLLIEHNLDVIKCADWIIDLGPEGGDKGGYLVAAGTPRDIVKNKKSYTGKYLKEVLR